MTVEFPADVWPDTEAILPTEVLSEIAARAPIADAGSSVSNASLEQLKTLNWPGIAVPEKFHGKGVSLNECCAAQRALAQADAGLAIAVNMHLFSVGLMVEHWRRRTDTSWLLIEAIATQNRILASAFAEPGLGGSTTRSTMTAQPVDGGWQVSGRKRPCSLAGEADLVCLQMQSADTDTAEVMVALLPTKAPGLSVIEDWNAMGMRGSASNTLMLTDCFIPDDLIFYRAPAGADNDDVLAAGIIWFCLTSTACYLGLALAGLKSAGQLLHRGRITHLGKSRAELPSYQAMLGDPIAQLVALESACANAATMMDNGTTPERLLPTVLSIKQTAICVVPRLFDALAEASGGASYTRSVGFERLWRDAQAIRFHPPTPAATRQYLARRALGLEASLDLDESVPAMTKAHPDSAHNGLF